VTTSDNRVDAADRIVTDAMLAKQRELLDDSMGAVARAVGRMRADNNRMRAELALLRAALTEIRDAPCDPEWVILRCDEALAIPS